MQSTAAFRFYGTLRFPLIQNLRYSGQGTAGMVVRLPIWPLKVSTLEVYSSTTYRGQIKRFLQ